MRAAIVPAPPASTGSGQRDFKNIHCSTGGNMIDPDIKVGDATFLKDGGNPIGAVHQLSPGGRAEFVIYVENAGDFIVPFTAIKTVHFDKIILDVTRLDAKLRAAIGHAHDDEAPE